MTRKHTPEEAKAAAERAAVEAHAHTKTHASWSSTRFTSVAVRLRNYWRKRNENI
jgi:hypothetical protein